MKILLKKAVKIENFLLEKGDTVILLEKDKQGYIKDIQGIQDEIARLVKQKQSTSDLERKKELSKKVNELRLKVAQLKVDKDNLKESVLKEKGNAVSYKLHSTQINLFQEKDYFFGSLQSKLPEEYVYREFPQVLVPGFSGSEYLTDNPSEDYGRETTPHVTVLYGLTDETSYFKIREYCSKVKPFTIELSSVSLFENEECNVLKVDVRSLELTSLSNWIRDNCLNNNKFPEYKAHMTISYVKKDVIMDMVRELYGDGFGNTDVNKEYLVSEIQFYDKNLGGYYLPIPLGD